METSHHADTEALARIEEAIAFTGDGRSSYYRLAREGLRPMPVKIGARASAVPIAELRAVSIALVGGASDDQLRGLVSRLHANRAKAAAAVLGEA